jgi:hypothetical protein
VTRNHTIDVISPVTDTQGPGKVGIEAVTCYAVAAGDAPGVSSGGGQGPDGTMKVPTLTIFCHGGHPPADDIFVYDGCP